MNNTIINHQFSFFPIHFRKNHNQIKQNLQNLHSQVLVIGKTAKFNTEGKKQEIYSQNHQYFKLAILSHYILVKRFENNEIIEAVETNSGISFRVIQQKLTTGNNSQDFLLASINPKPKKRLVFSFKGLNQITTQFYLISDTNFSQNKFIDKLKKTITQKQDFHQRFKPSRRLYAGQNFTFIKSKDLLLNRDVVVKAYRKDNKDQQKQLWKECQCIKEAQRLNDNNVLQVQSFHQTSNSFYIIFEKFDYFIQNFSRRLNQKYQTTYSCQYQKKLIVVLEIISKIIKTIKKLHEIGYTMNGSYTESNLIFKQVEGLIEPKLIPIINNYCKNNEMEHKIKLQEKVLQFTKNTSFQILPPEHFNINQWQHLNDQAYFSYLTKAQVFGLGNLLHTLLFDHSVFGKNNQNNINQNNRNGKYVLSKKIQELNMICPQIIDLLSLMIQKNTYLRIQFDNLQQKIDQLLLKLTSQPQTTAQIMYQQQKQMKEQYLNKTNFKEQQIKQRLFCQAEKNIQINGNKSLVKGKISQELQVYPFKKRKSSQN